MRVILVATVLFTVASAPCFAQSVNGAAVSAAQGVDAGEKSKPRQVKPPVATGKKEAVPEQAPRAPVLPK